MKNTGQFIKKCGDLRGPCGDLKSKVPASYSFVGEDVTGLAGTCGDFSYTLYTRARARTHTRAHMRKANPLQDSAGPRNVTQLSKRQGIGLRGLGIRSPRKDPAETPQGPRKAMTRATEAS